MANKCSKNGSRSERASDSHKQSPRGRRGSAAVKQRRIRLIRNQPIFLDLTVDCDRMFVVRVFRETCREIPLSARREILEYVKANTILSIQVWPMLRFRPRFLAKCSQMGHEIVFASELMNAFPERKIKHTVAHELSHLVYNQRDMKWIEPILEQKPGALELLISDLLFGLKLRDGEAEVERRVDALAASWGFPRPAQNAPWTEDDIVRIRHNLDAHIAAEKEQEKLR
jgi:hypothetical protein